MSVLHFDACWLNCLPLNDHIELTEYSNGFNIAAWRRKVEKKKNADYKDSARNILWINAFWEEVIHT